MCYIRYYGKCAFKSDIASALMQTCDVALMNSWRRALRGVLSHTGCCEVRCAPRRLPLGGPGVQGEAQPASLCRSARVASTGSLARTWARSGAARSVSSRPLGFQGVPVVLEAPRGRRLEDGWCVVSLLQSARHALGGGWLACASRWCPRHPRIFRGPRGSRGLLAVLDAVDLQ